MCSSDLLEQARLDWDQRQAQRAEQEQVLADLEAAQLEDPQERQRLAAEESRLAHGVRLQEGVMTLIGRLLEGADQAPSVLDHLAACEQELIQMEALDGSLQLLRQSCSDGLVALQDLARDLDRYGASLESEPENLAALQERMAQLKTLERRHGLDLAGLIERRDGLREQLGPEIGRAHV